MTRAEAIIVTLIGLAVVTAACTWMFAGWGLLGGGIGFSLFGIFSSVKED